jgi:hypothetical protein
MLTLSIDSESELTCVGGDGLCNCSYSTAARVVIRLAAVDVGRMPTFSRCVIWKGRHIRMR